MAAVAQRAFSSIGSKTRRVVKAYDETLPVKLTPEEQWDAAVAACDAMQEYDRVEELKKARNKADTETLKKLRKRASEESRKVKKGVDEREVRVEEAYDFMEERVFMIRTDTGEVIGERPATDAERQESLDLGGQAS